MSNIPEYTLLQILRFQARGMPLEQIAFMTRIDPDIIEAAVKEQKEAIDRIPEEHLEMIRKLGRENMPVGRIASMTHMSERTVHEVLAIADIEPTPNPSEAGSSC
jgi:DNA-directed RNA polymerase specialized sigma24 family protein